MYSISFEIGNFTENSTQGDRTFGESRMVTLQIFGTQPERFERMKTLCMIKSKFFNLLLRLA